MPEQFNFRSGRARSRHPFRICTESEKILSVPENTDAHSESEAFNQWIEVCEAVWKRNRERADRDRSERKRFPSGRISMGRPESWGDDLRET